MVKWMQEIDQKKKNTVCKQMSERRPITSQYANMMSNGNIFRTLNILTIQV